MQLLEVELSGDERQQAPELPYALEFDKSSNTLYGIVMKPELAPAEPESGAPRPRQAVTEYSLRRHVEELGYQDFFFPANSLKGFVKTINDKADGRYILAYRKDATIEVDIAVGALAATAKTTRAWGGAPLDREKILNEIRRNKLLPDRIDKQALGTLLNDTLGVKVTLATALQPTAGRNASLDPLLNSRTVKSRDTESTASIDQREMFEFTVVDPGTPLLKRTPATRGTSGVDVLGREIKPVPGKDLQFAKPFEGVEPSPEDENILVATIKGHPVFFSNGVRVDPILSLEAVNINSGNVDYDGSVFIKENIESGFTVTATGDIYVKGQVERATVRAGGGIFIQGGVLGSENKDEEGYNAYLFCEGDLSAKFLSQASVICGGKITVAEYILHCQVEAKNAILVGQERGRGYVIGGFCHSDSEITAKILGTEAYVATVVSAGLKENYQTRRRLENEHARRTQEAEQLSALLESLATTGSSAQLGKLQLDKARKIEIVLARLRERITAVEEEIDHHKATQTNEPKINATDKVHPNTVIIIEGVQSPCKLLAKRKTYMREADQVKATDLQ